MIYKNEREREIETERERNRERGKKEQEREEGFHGDSVNFCRLGLLRRFKRQL